MRRALRDSLPRLTREFGILPHHLDDMTRGEIDTYIAAVKRLDAARRRKKGRR